MDVLNRRTVLGGGTLSIAAAAALPATAQPATRTFRLAFVHSGFPVAELTEQTGPYWVRRFFEALRKSGLVEGRNLAVERFSAEGDSERFAGLVEKVVATKPDVILTNLNPLIALFKAATSTIPIVAIAADPVGAGLVSSLSRPGGNITGVTIEAGMEIYLKHLQILKEAVPSLSRLAILATTDFLERTLASTARQFNMTLLGIRLVQVSAEHLRQSFEDMARQKTQAILVSGAGEFVAHRALICELANRHHLPGLYPYRDYVDAGGLMAYAPDLGELAQRMADDVRQILNGAKPGEIPIYQPGKLQLIINLKTAKALSLEMPSTLLARADEVIE